MSEATQAEKTMAAAYANAVLEPYETLLTKNDAYLLVALAYLQGQRDAVRTAA